MAAVVPHLIAHLGSPLRDTIFATDAMGSGRDTEGGASLQQISITSLRSRAFGLPITQEKLYAN